MPAFQIEMLEPSILLNGQHLNYYHQTVNSDSVAVCSPTSRQQQNASMLNSDAGSSKLSLIVQTSFSFSAPDYGFSSLDSATQSIRSASISNSSESSLQDHQGDSEAKGDSHVLYNMNHNLKSSLTNLLNSQAVRENEQMRAWVQMRLMEAERDLKRQRRKRMSVTSVLPS